MPLLCAELSSGLGGDTGFCSSLGCWGIQEENGGSPGSEAVDGVEQLVCFTIRTVLIPSPGRQQLVYRENSKDTLLQHHGFPGVSNSWKDQSTPRGLNTNSFHSAFPGLFFSILSSLRTALVSAPRSHGHSHLRCHFSVAVT